ncbi:23S rRNA (adenine(2503)-C(2))-methyltransferase RlmN [Hathewaya histolytica]|uniref:Probable dual-specificity RNA methyltransferase RlmN n=1 Tax=Hathewaya histolytica TaxID=1498 RepID=A0A4V6KDZ9_HATHI|nr:23S rRNA (adenine(2503)-C(2))-methyltransferase RlmN [Hathewaya histolytica]VTQ90137.1 ribosomal RNA large subunit methyltransferase N [Hathewaya histolytica]
MNNILDFNLEELKIWMVDNGESSFRAKQVLDWIYKGVWDFNDMKNLSNAIKQKLKDNFKISIPKIVSNLKSTKDNTTKFLLAYDDGNLIETVVMKYKHGNCICVSTQIGCRMGCTFCASTLDGVVRNLSTGEIIAQILVAQKYIEERISNIVLMGSGEPLDNYNNVIKFIRLVSEKYTLNIGKRHITLSTCGIVPKIKDLADEETQITLAISLHAPTDFIRKQSMPIANKYSIKELIDICNYYIEKTGRRITFEYALIKNFNDRDIHAEELSKILKGLLCHVNLIPVNEVKEKNYERSDNDSIEKFKNILEKNKIQVTIRREMGSDINAACGQLRRSYLEKEI